MTDTKITIERDLELIDGMIEVQLHHAEQCDHIANRTMAEKQKGWDMERVALLRKMRAALEAQTIDGFGGNLDEVFQPVEPVAWLEQVTVSSGNCSEPTNEWHVTQNPSTSNAPRRPLYAAPAAVPMTEEVLNIHKPYYSNIEWPCFKAGVRFAEMVHGTAATTCHVPPGWKLVPIEPTEAMIASGAVALVKASHSDIDPTMEEVTAAYRAMIAAGDKP